MFFSSMNKVMGLFGLMAWSVGSLAGSELSYPSDWQSWQSVSTPLAKIGALPGCDADVSSLPPIYQETVEIYCGVREGGPGAVDVLVRSGSTDSYKARNGDLGEGASMILHLKDMKVLFVSGLKNGQPVYGVFAEDGTDAMSADPSSPLSANTCRECHSGYEAFCINGQCGTQK